MPLLCGLPFTALYTYKLESVQRRAARWVTRDYQYTSSLSAMLQDLNWRPLDQRRTDRRLVLLYKVTYDIVAIPAGDYLIRNTRRSAKNHPLAYRQITTLKDYYTFTFFPRTIIHWNALPAHIPILPNPGTVQYSCLPGCPYKHLKRQYLFLSFSYTNTLDRTVQTHFTHFSFLILQVTPSSTWFTGTHLKSSSEVKMQKKIDRETELFYPK